jgi:hypothetical protein
MTPFKFRGDSEIWGGHKLYVYSAPYDKYDRNTDRGSFISAMQERKGVRYCTLTEKANPSTRSPEIS